MNPADQFISSIIDSGDPIEQFAARLLQDKGVTETLTVPTLEQMHKDLVTRLERLTHKVAVDALDDKSLEELEQKMDSSVNSDQLQAFFKERIPDLSDRLAKAYYEFRTLYLGAT